MIQIFKLIKMNLRDSFKMRQLIKKRYVIILWKNIKIKRIMLNN